ncbi:YdcF family protein [Anthocerotibacter panamensis]|uniref:YdcF family protein n=1 Tax=Anthocerotibacter panamensis TaxID=2857077 RepID=UPI001C407E45|nr:YdcF family protein [Anthocerotibacter panamensis]
MLDPALCERSSLLWPSLTWRLQDWLTVPWLVVLPLALLVILAWQVRPLPGRRLVFGLSALMLGSYLLAILPPMIDLALWGLTAPLPADTGTKVDAIVILGRGDQLRPARAAVAGGLWRTGRAPLVFSSGRGDATELMDLLRSQGLPQQAVAGEDCSQTTEENARFTALVLKPQGVRRILLVTDPPHLLRSVLTFRRQGFTVLPQSSPLPPLPFPQRAFIVYREYLGLILYGLSGRLSQQTAAESILRVNTGS